MRLGGLPRVVPTFPSRAGSGFERLTESTRPYIRLLRSFQPVGSSENADNEFFCMVSATGNLAFREMPRTGFGGCVHIWECVAAPISSVVSATSNDPM